MVIERMKSRFINACWQAAVGKQEKGEPLDSRAVRRCKWALKLVRCGEFELAAKLMNRKQETRQIWKLALK